MDKRWILAFTYLNDLDSIPRTKAVDLDQTNNLKIEINHLNLLPLFLRISHKIREKDS